MRPDTISALAAFLAVGGLQLVAAQDAPEAHVQRPRWYFPQEVKRTIRRSAEPDPGSILDSLFDNSGTTKVSSTTATTSDSSVTPQPQKGQEVVVVTISIDPKNPEITHRITGTTIIGGEPTGTTTTTTQKTEGSSTKVTSKKNSEAASVDAETTRKQGSATPASTKAASNGIVGDLTSGLDKLLGSDSTSSTATTPFDSSAKATSPASSTGATSTVPSSTTTSGSDLLGLLGLGGKSSTSTSTSATVPLGASNATTIAVNVPGFTTPPSTTPTGTTTGILGDFAGSLTSIVDSLIHPTSTTNGSIALIPTATMPGGSLLPPKSTGLIPGPTGTNSGVISTPTNSLGSIPTPHSHVSDSTSQSGSDTVSGSTTASAPLFTTTPTGPVSGSGSYGGSKIPISTSHPAPTPRPVVTSTTSTTKEVNTAKPTVEPPTSTETLMPPTSNDNDWMPSTILIMPTVTATQSSTSGETAKPTAPSLPGSITPSHEVTEPPRDSMLLQLGFNGQLPWSFVATTPLSSSQIFNYTPQAIENALPALSAKDGPVMFAIEPYYNWKTTGYNATIAIFYFPRDKVDALQALKVNPNSALYKQESESIKSLMAMVDPTIPLEFSGNYPNSNSDSPEDKNHGGSDDGPDSGNNDNTDGSAGSSKAKASSVGIGVGVVAGAAAYGAGMFWVARRYRKRKQLHQRSSSTVEQMSQGGSAAGSMFAAGSRVPSHGSRGTARSQMISAPVMAENSLGWN